uniref:Uncharacterized protein n=1 Tax=Acrobeloides nanus TaxID=290746 RepID=A0A914D675_9BILA
MPHIPSPVNPYTPPSIAVISPPTAKTEPIDDKPLSPLSETFSESMNNEILASYDTRRRPSVVLAAELMDPGPLPTDAISVMLEKERKKKEIMKYVI